MRRRKLISMLYVIAVGLSTALHGQDLFKPKAPKKLKYLSPKKKYTDKKDGYMIITTNDLSHRLKKLQSFISCKANVRKFRVFMATENDWSGKSEAGKMAKKRGAPQGRLNGHDILHFLKKTYIPLNIKYVLFVGDARPDEGTTPMLRIHHHKDYKNFIRGENKSSHPAAKLSNSEGRYTEWGEVISDYPYIDLDSDWDYDKDGFLDPTEDPNAKHTREAEVFVGRVPYYGEDSPYAKAADVDIILDRFVRYDTEKDINWRYHIMYQLGGQNSKIPQFCEEHGIDYTLISRGNKGKIVGLPAIRSKHGGEHLENFEIIQDYGTAFFGTHSHGGPTGMEGLSSGHIATAANDRYPTVLTLGACSIGDIYVPQNLIYTLLRFHTIAASGGTGSVTSYGGNHGYVMENDLGKDMRLMKGESAGEAHWGWYSGLYKNSKRIPMTGAKINLYGDPSATPLRYGPTPPYPFIAKPVAGHFAVAPAKQAIPTIKPHAITLQNHKKRPARILAVTNVKWLKVSPQKISLAPGSKRKTYVTLNKTEAMRLPPGVHEAKVQYKSSNGYTCERRYVLKINEDKIRAYYSFDKESHHYQNEIGTLEKRMDGFGMPKSVTKFEPGSGGHKPVIVVPGKYDNGVNLNHAPSGYIYPFDKENISMTFWVKFNSLPSGEKEIFAANRFFYLRKTGTGLSLSISNWGLNGIKVINKTLSGNITWEAGRWYHLGFTVDQKSGSVKLFVDGKKLASEVMPKYVTYATDRAWFGTCDGVLDELFIYNDNLSEANIRGLADGKYVERVIPEPKNNAVSPSGVAFDFKTGIAPKNMCVIYQARGDSKKNRVFPNKNGVFAPVDLKSNTVYDWRVVTRDKSFTSKKFSFKTAKEMVPNGQFRTDTAGWKGGTLSIIKPDQKRDYNRMRVQGTTTTQLIGKIEPNKFYVMTAKVDVAYYQHCVMRLYSKGDLGKRELLKEHQVWPHNNGKAMDINISFFADSNSPLIGKELSLELNPGQGRKTAREYFIGKLSMVSFSPGSRNVPPVLIKPLDDYKPTIKVGQIGWQTPLRKFAKDPEKGRLRFEVLHAPSWLYVQGDDTLFSNFGPPADAVGEHKVKLVAIDPDNGKLEFEFTIKAVR